VRQCELWLSSHWRNLTDVSIFYARFHNLLKDTLLIRALSAIVRSSHYKPDKVELSLFADSRVLVEVRASHCGLRPSGIPLVKSHNPFSPGHSFLLPGSINTAEVELLASVRYRTD
jgi:hypothetical protein